MATAGTKAERDALKDENKALLKTLGYRHQTFEEWEQLLPQETRDALAARALIAAEGDFIRAAIRLGFTGRYGHKFPMDLLPRIFGTEGVQEILKRDLSEPEKCRAAMVARMVQTTLYGEEGNAVKAFTMLAKVCGWWRGPDVLIQHNKQNVLALVTQKNHRGQGPEEALPPAFLEHEPGAAVRIDSGPDIAAVLESDEEV